MGNIAIIPARGGSKRIPKKVIREFCGKPIIAYSIRAALDSNLFDEVMVSTDDPVVAGVAKRYGASVPFLRSAENSDDFATTVDAVTEVIEQYNSSLGKTFEILCCLYPAAPFVDAELLRDSMSKLDESGADALMPVVKFSYPPQRGVIIQGDYLEYKWPENAKARSQDLEPLYHDAGQFYITRVSAFQSERKLMCAKTIPFILPERRVQDIDTLEDWEQAAMKYVLLNGIQNSTGAIHE